MTTQRIELPDLAATDALGARLADALPAGSVVSLIGPLGAGKTRLVQAITAALGSRAEVTSPTYVLVNEYTDGRVPVYHFDAYRIADDDEFLELGAEEYFTVGGSAGLGICLVEWGDRVSHLLPEGCVEVRVSIGNDDDRVAEIAGVHLDD
ncbi:MAG: tRNA (adenosine(37)-N6)-threonylcarbamoyltransferase complex ATPase subunit type 1 TsaE [Planctomycetota bacterium]